MTTAVRPSPLLPEHQRLGARIFTFSGWLMPLAYRGIVAEHQAVRQAAGLFDLSHMGALEVSGPEAVAMTRSLITGELGRLAPGQALYTLACSEQGGILDDLVVYRRHIDRVLVICNASNRTRMVAHFADRIGARARVWDMSDTHVLLAVQGPRTPQVLAAAGCSLDLATDLARFWCAEAVVADRRCLVARTGYTGEDGVELLCSCQDAAPLWRALLEAGEPLGMVPVGLGARDTLRLEAGLPLYGHEIDETTHPFEARLGWTVHLEGGEFLGKEALARLRTAPLLRRLVGFEMVDRAVARHSYPLLDESGRGVGVCTSGAPSPTLGKNIGLGYLPVGMTNPGTRFWVDCRGKPAEAVVTSPRFYRRPGPGEPGARPEPRGDNGRDCEVT